MNRFVLLFICLTVIFSPSFGQNYNDPGQLVIGGFKIGDKIDTTQFKKYDDLYFPNYLDGWTMENSSQLPDKYKGLPIAIWQSKSDSAVALTLLNDMVLNITVSYLTKVEKDSIEDKLNEKFGTDGKKKSFEQTHPFQSWITYWDLKTWETEDVIVQIGNSHMRKPKDPEPKNIRWNLVYSDFRLESEVINSYKKK